MLINNENQSEVLGEDIDNSKWLSYIKAEVDRMGHLTRDLLYLTQMEGAEAHQMMKTEFNLSEKIEQMLLGVEAVATDSVLPSQKRSLSNMVVK